ncbi:related to protocatechuate 3,4-dioxygenase beta subunit [Armillaria ostoyae]|uniref:Related to protocatechuate 3,4-dioxygenase beta subunit n=1 Tax=Armillaria ostoyae TaxID=47428 RepID=A0A284S1A7_ARMOS|nr:related to protocatechuate 3,4-dioxygenase beta subunit [Armillaria ostoyae]
MLYLTSLVSVALLVANSVVGHPGEAPPTSVELSRRAQLETATRRSLADCQSHLARRGYVDRSIARRTALAEQLRKKRGLATSSPYKRALTVDEVINTSHLSNVTGLTSDSDPFTSNSSCVLTPELEQGPYYVQGEYIRSDMSEDQTGVPAYVDIELIDVSTCEPLTGVYLDVWHCNATGVYAGIVADGNGDSSVESNWNTTFLRGIQQMNDEGYAQFETIFPGHYSGRTTHFHMIVHEDGTIFDNGTFKSDGNQHIGQAFFEQDLITAVEATAPYNTNTISITQNEDDRVFVGGVVPDSGTGVDPIFEYVYLGDDLSGGLLLWGTIGVDLTASYESSPGGYLTEAGGIVNSNATAIGVNGGAPSGGNGTDVGFDGGNSTTTTDSGNSTSTDSSSTVQLLCTCSSI